MKVALILGLTLLTTACAVTPKATFVDLKTPTAEVSESFYLPETVVQISVAESVNAQTKAVIIRPQATARAVEHRGTKIGIIPHRRFGVDSHIAVTKRENTDLVQSVNAEAIDHRADYITRIGGVLKTLAPVVFTGSGPLTAEQLPVEVNLSQLLNGNRAAVQGGAAATSESGVTVQFGPPSPSARPLTELFATKQPLTGFPYAACRDATISFEFLRTDAAAGPSPQPTKFSAGFRVADPYFFELAPFPRKGKIAMHSICGASVEPERAAADPSIAIAEALAAQAAAIQKAVEDARK